MPPVPESVRRPVLGAAPWLGRFCLRWPGLVVFAVVIAFSALLSTLVGPQPHAQSQEQHPTDTWAQDGTVQVEQTALTIREGESKSYRLRLNRQPLEDGWWVMVLVDGAKRYDGLYDKDGDLEDDISWVPSVGWQVDVTNDINALAATPWRNITITAKQDADTEDQTITFAHELWDHDAYCPPALHGGGTPLAMVTVHIIDDDRTTPPPPENTDSNGGNGDENGTTATETVTGTVTETATGTATETATENGNGRRQRRRQREQRRQQRRQRR